MSYYSEFKKVSKMFARMTTGGSKASLSVSATPKQKKVKKVKKAKKKHRESSSGLSNKEKAKVITKAQLIELSDWEVLLKEVSIALLTVPPHTVPSSSRSKCNWIIILNIANW